MRCLSSSSLLLLPLPLRHSPLISPHCSLTLAPPSPVSQCRPPSRHVPWRSATIDSSPTCHSSVIAIREWMVQTADLIVGIATLTIIAYGDVRERRIPNALSLAIAALGLT